MQCCNRVPTGHRRLNSDLERGLLKHWRDGLFGAKLTWTAKIHETKSKTCCVMQSEEKDLH